MTKDNVKTEVGSTIGYFDALHRGHQLLLYQLKVSPYPVKLVITFNISPKLTLYRNTIPPILTNSEKERMLRYWGFEPLFLEFPKVRRLTPEEFCLYLRELILEKYGHLKEVIVGDDFRFGYNRSGDTAKLKSIGKDLGFSVRVFRKLKEGEVEISTTRIKELLLLGDVMTANHLLGYAYYITSEVISAKGIGRKLGFPTANLSMLPGKLYPKAGIYIARVWLEEGEINPHFLGPGLAHLGPKPTLNDNTFSFEIWIDGFSGSLYGKSLTVELLDYVRPVMRFRDINELAEAIKSDIEVMRRKWERIRVLFPPWWEVNLNDERYPQLVKALQDS